MGGFENPVVVFHEAEVRPAVGNSILEPSQQKLWRQTVQIRGVETVDEVVEEQSPVGSPNLGEVNQILRPRNFHREWEVIFHRDWVHVANPNPDYVQPFFHWIGFGAHLSRHNGIRALLNTCPQLALTIEGPTVIGTAQSARAGKAHMTAR